MRCLASYDDMPKDLAIRILNDDLLMKSLAILIRKMQNSRTL
jgi:hypothetical protein